MVKIQRIHNKLSLNDESKALVDRLVTAEASHKNPNVVRKNLGSEGPIQRKLVKALIDIRNHTKRNTGLTLTEGSLFFRIDNEQSRPILFFTSNLQTDRPIANLGYATGSLILMPMIEQ